VALAAVAISPHTALSGERVDALTPRMAVRLGTSAANVVDMAVGDDALYTLDVAEGAVRAYPLDRFEQQPGPETLLAQAGTPVSGATRSLAQPVAIEYLPGEPGSLAIVDQWRTVAQLTEAGLVAPELPTSANWQELGALGVGGTGELLFLDARAHRLLGYSVQGQAVADPPRVLLEDGLPFERVTQVVGEAESVVARLDDGTVQRLDPTGMRQELKLPPIAGHASPVSAIAPDRAGGLYLADPLDARVVQTRLDGTPIRQLRSPLLAGMRAIGISLDGRRLFALVATGVLVADIPAL
jgi:hypothetical protein